MIPEKVRMNIQAMDGRIDDRMWPDEWREAWRWMQEWLDSPAAPEPDWRVLRAALAALVGADTKEELDMMEMAIRSTAAPDKDKAVVINAIDALRETLPEAK